MYYYCPSQSNPPIPTLPPPFSVTPLDDTHADKLCESFQCGTLRFQLPTNEQNSSCLLKQSHKSEISLQLWSLILTCCTLCSFQNHFILHFEHVHHSPKCLQFLLFSSSCCLNNKFQMGRTCFHVSTRLSIFSVSWEPDSYNPMYLLLKIMSLFSNVKCRKMWRIREAATFDI